MKYRAEQYGLAIRVAVNGPRAPMKPKRTKPVKAEDLPLTEPQQDWLYIQSRKLIDASLAAYGV